MVLKGSKLEERRVLPKARGFPRLFSSVLRFQTYRSDKVVVPYLIVALDGTGDYDDIQAALDSLPSGGTVYIKEGTYNITSAITTPVFPINLIGAGKTTKIQSTGDHAIIDSRSSNTRISALFLYGSGLGNTSNHGILIKDKNSYVFDCWIENCGGHGILTVFPANTSFITRNTINQNYGHGIFIDGTDTFIISNNVITANDFNETETYDGVKVTGCNYSMILHNFFQRNYGYQINIASGSFAMVVANILSSPPDRKITDSGTDTQIAHNLT